MSFELIVLSWSQTVLGKIIAYSKQAYGVKLAYMRPQLCVRRKAIF